MKPFRSVAIPHRDILEGRLTMDVFAADLWEVYRGRAPEDYRDPEIFFRKTYLTAGLKNLLSVASKRLRGEGGDPVIQIQTPFGGGKTHSLIALYHAFTSPDSVRPYFKGAMKANVVVIVGTAISPKEEGGRIEGTLWEEIERQLEGRVEEMTHPISPGKEALRELLEKHQPLLILMDEVLEYVAKAAGIKRGYSELRIGDTNLAAQTIAFMQELTETVKSLDRTLLVVTLPSSVVEYPDEERAQELLLKLQKVAGRIERVYSPVSGDEIYDVIRRRLFSEVDDEGAREVVNEFVDYYEKEGLLVSKAEYREKMLRTYPFHPETIDVLHKRWGSLPTFQRTRGVLRILSLVVHRLKDSSAPLIRPCDFDLAFDELAEELLKHIGREYESVLRADVTAWDSNSRKVDETLGSAYKGLGLATKVATAIFLYSFSGGERGATLGELKLACADVNIPTSVITEVVEKLSGSLYYLWKEEGRYVFKSQPNLNKLLVSKMAEIEEPELMEEARSLVTKYAGSALATYVWPGAPRDVPDGEELKLVIMQRYDLDLLKRILEEYGDNPRVNKNTLFFLAPLESERYGFESWLRRKIAWRRISEDRSLNLTDAQREEIDSNIKAMSGEERDELRKLYRVVIVPAKELKEVSLGIPTFGDRRPLSLEVFEKLKEEGEIVERLSPVLITERYMRDRDYLELVQLYRALLSTPGEPRIRRDKFIASIREAVRRGNFGFGYLEDSRVRCTVIESTPEISLREGEVIVRKELCEEKKRTGEGKAEGELGPAGPVGGPIGARPPVGGTREGPTPEGPFITSVSLSLRIPRGRFSDFYRGVLGVLEDSFEETEVVISLKAKGGRISRSRYEDTVRETLTQIGAEILEEETEE